METEQYFDVIDEGIAAFKTNKKCWVSKDTHSDWLVFDTRKIGWSRDGMNFFIQIFPNFDDEEKIISWTLYAAAWFDKTKGRYSLDKVFADKVPLKEIADNILPLLNESYNYINSFRKFDLPKVLDF